MYLVFGSRAGLFDALATDLWARAGLANLTEAVAHPDAREHLRGGMRAGVEIYAAIRDVAAHAVLDVGARPGVRRRRDRRASRNAGGAACSTSPNRLAEQDQLRPDVTVDEAADVLWMLASFASFDTLYTDRGLPGRRGRPHPRRDRRAHALPLSSRPAGGQAW